MSLKKNIISLFSAQVVGYLVPLLQLPYLSRVLGAELLGLYLFTLSITALATIITNFGFDISVAKRIAEGERDNIRLSIFIFEVNALKTVLFLISSLVVCLSIYLSGHFVGYYHLIPIILIMVFGNTYRLNWLFQGVEKLYIFSRITIVTKLVSLLLIFFCVKSSEDFVFLIEISALQAVLATALCFLIIYKWKLSFYYTSMKSVWLLCKESSEYFLSRLGVSLYSTLGSFFLGLFSGSLQQVAIYGVAEQLYKAGVYAMSAISTPLTPYMARTKNYTVFFKVTVMSMLLTFIGAGIGWFWGDEIIRLIFGSNMKDAYVILKIFMITIVISVLGMHMGYPALIPLGRQRVANYSVVFGGLLQLAVISLLLIFNLGVTAFSIAISYLLCDLLMATIRIISFTKSYKMRVLK